MEAAVPFALLSGVQLLCVVASLALAASAVLLRRSRPAVVLGALGGLLLATSHVLVATLLGEPSNDAVALLRFVGYGLVAAALATVRRPLGGFPVVAPVGAASSPALLAAVAAAVAAGAAWRTGSERRRWLGPAFAAAAVAEALGPLAVDDDRVAVAALLLRGLWAMLVFGALGELAHRSLRVKVVAAIVAAVVAIAVGASAVTGTVVTSGFNSSHRERISAVARGELENLQDTAELNSRLSLVLSDCLVAGGTDAQCAELFSRFRREAVIFTPRFDVRGRVACACNLEPAAAVALGSSDFLAEVLRDGGTNASLLVLTGAQPRIYAVGATAIRTLRQGPVRGAAVYATVVDDARLVLDAGRTGYDLTAFDAEGNVLATSLETDDVQTVADIFTSERVVSEVARGVAGVVVDADGSRPTVRYTPLRDARDDLIAVLALSAPSGQILRTQRSVLRVLFGTTLLIGLLAALLALALARRITKPIESLTTTASRIRAGDLTATSSIDSPDEVGVLSRAFDAMTRSLSTSNEELRRAAAEQSSLRARLSTILDSMGDGLVITDVEGRVSGLNPVGEQVLGISGDAAEGRPLADVLVGVSASGAPLLADGADAGTGVVHRPDGSRVPVSVVRTPLRDGDGSVVVVRDTTREAQVERMKTEFLSNVSHELRTPLTPIRGYAELLQRRPDLPPDKTRDYIGTIFDSSVRMSRVVDLLVDVAALEAGRVVPHPEPVAVADVIDRRVDVWRGRAKQQEFRRRVAAGLPPVLVDASWVAKAVDELVDNAVKYGGRAPITLSAAMEDGRVRLTVRDLGPGIERDAQQVLFSDFEQVDGSATREVGGLGLGLSFVRRVAEEFGLGLGFASTPGKGAAFWLDLPIAVPPPPQPRRSSTRTRRPAGRARTAAAKARP